MAQGKAVLGSDVGGMRELIRDKVTGLLFQADSVEDFCRQAERLIREEPWRRELGERARRSILEEKDWKILVGRYELVYAAAIGNARARELAADASRKGYQQIPL
jgi:glycosyltransferase involved in cell wall biosynthesis